MSHWGMDVLPRQECLDLLRGASLGRIGVWVGATKAILPVNYACLGDDVVIRTDPGTKLIAAVLRTEVVFEVDDTDPDTRTGWSVNVVGHIEEIRHPDEITAAQALPLETWAEGVRDSFVRIRAEQVTGRRIRHEA